MNIPTSINSDLVYQTENMYNFINKPLSNSFIIFIFFIVILIYIAMSLSLGKQPSLEALSSGNLNIEMSNPINNKSTQFIGSSNYSASVNSDTNNSFYIGIIILVILLCIINAIIYIYDINIVTYINGLFSDNLNVNIQKDNDKVPPPVPEIQIAPQVFNIPDNNYTYQDAKAVCSAYGGRLASYNEVEDAYNKGASWCSYGWSDGQMALFPTQEDYYNELQKIKGHEHDCGRPGVNGGYMSNSKSRFGVNCYGLKPKITDDEEYLMENQPIYPETLEERVFEKKVDYYKKKLNDILVSPFNPSSWSKY